MGRAGESRKATGSETEDEPDCGDTKWLEICSTIATTHKVCLERKSAVARDMLELAQVRLTGSK